MRNLRGYRTACSLLQVCAVQPLKSRITMRAGGLASPSSDPRLPRGTSTRGALPAAGGDQRLGPTIGLAAMPSADARGVGPNAADVSVMMPAPVGVGSDRRMSHRTPNRQDPSATRARACECPSGHEGRPQWPRGSGTARTCHSDIGLAPTWAGRQSRGLQHGNLPGPRLLVTAEPPRAGTPRRGSRASDRSPRSPRPPPPAAARRRRRLVGRSSRSRPGPAVWGFVDGAGSRRPGNSPSRRPPCARHRGGSP